MESNYKTLFPATTDPLKVPVTMWPPRPPSAFRWLTYEIKTKKRKKQKKIDNPPAPKSSTPSPSAPSSSANCARHSSRSLFSHSEVSLPGSSPATSGPRLHILRGGLERHPSRGLSDDSDPCKNTFMIISGRTPAVKVKLCLLIPCMKSNEGATFASRSGDGPQYRSHPFCVCSLHRFCPLPRGFLS